MSTRLGSEVCVFFARLLRVVVGISLAAEEASTRTSEETEGALSVEEPRDSQGAVAPSRCHPVHLCENSRRPTSPEFSPSTSLRDSSWRAGCITKGACPVWKGALGNLPARAAKAPSVHLTLPPPMSRNAHSGLPRSHDGGLRTLGTPASHRARAGETRCLPQTPPVELLASRARSMPCFSILTHI